MLSNRSLGSIGQRYCGGPFSAGASFPAFLGADVRLGPRHRSALRECYRQDLRAVNQITGFQYVRFHAIFHDEVGVYDEDEQGKPIYNFSYVDQIYDGLLANGVRPFVELSFMPYKLAANAILQSFWYKPNVSPPKDWAKWDDLITQFTKHLVDRYGIDEVASGTSKCGTNPTSISGRASAAANLLRALRPHRARHQGGKPAPARGRPGHGAGRLGRRHD